VKYLKPGIGNAASYQVSGVPWYHSFVVPSSGEIVTISFPRVTKTIIIKNTDTVSSNVTVGFDAKQLEYNTGEYFQISNGESVSLDFKMIDIHFQSKNLVEIPISIVAGLTNIERIEFSPQLVISDIGILSEQDEILTTENNFNIIVE